MIKQRLIEDSEKSKNQTQKETLLEQVINMKILK